MNALLIVTVLALHDDGSITKSREMSTQPSMEACIAEATKRAADMEKNPGVDGEVHFNCTPMATLEVIKPPEPQPGKKVLPPLKPDRTS